MPKTAAKNPHRKEVDLRIFNSKGVYAGHDTMEFEHEYNRPRKTFMPAAVNTLKERLRSGDIGTLSGIAQTLQDDPGSFILVDERHGFPQLIKAEELRPKK